MADSTHVTSKVATKIISALVTPGLTQTDTTARVPLGTICYTDMGGVAEYGQAISEISAYAFSILYDGGSAEQATTTLCNQAGAGSRKIGCPQAYSSASFGWFMRQGTFMGRFSDDCADQVPLFTTANAGELDDATVSNCLVAGIYLNTTESLATALTCYAGMPMCVVPYTNPA